MQRKQHQLGQTKFGHKIDCWAAIYGRIWMNNVPNESRIIMLSRTKTSFVYIFLILRNLESNPGFLFFLLFSFNSHCMHACPNLARRLITCVLVIEKWFVTYLVRATLRLMIGNTAKLAIHVYTQLDRMKVLWSLGQSFSPKEIHKKLGQNLQMLLQLFLFLGRRNDNLI